jgi:Domain of unknown function (DUF4845)
MRERQRGMTFLGLMILLSFIGIFIYAGIKLAPVYLQGYKVMKAIGDIKHETDGAAVTPPTIQRALEKRFDIEDITEVKPKEVDITKTETGYTVHAAYDVPVPFVGNLSFLVHFEKTVDLSAS